MYPKLQELRSEINNLTAGSLQVGLNWAGFNMAYEVYKDTQRQTEHTPINLAHSGTPSI